MDGMVKRQMVKPPALLWTILRLTGMVGSPLSFSWDFLESAVAFSKKLLFPPPSLFCKPPSWFLGVLAFRNRIKKQPLCSAVPRQQMGGAGNTVLHSVISCTNFNIQNVKI